MLAASPHAIFWDDAQQANLDAVSSLASIPFEQEAWARPYGMLDAHDALDSFTAIRRWNLLFIRAVGAAAESKPVRHPERGEMTFRTIIETMGGHDINHLRQLENLV